MPELPEVETVRRHLARALVGRTIERVTVRRSDIVRGCGCSALSRALRGRTVLSVERLGKNLIVRLDRGLALLVHLGMTGRFQVLESGCRLPKHTHLRAELSGGRLLIFRDPRRFGHLEVCASDNLAQSETLRNVGLDAMSERFTARRLGEMLAGRTGLLKSALMDQSRLAGLGNIYVCEVMHRAGMSPQARCGELSDQQVRRLHRAIRRVLAEAIAAEGTTIADYLTGAGVPGGFQERLRVYGREGESCRRRGCAGIIKRIVQSNRSTFYCPDCQRDCEESPAASDTEVE
ncbi:MAG: bifunctional DNA-formamidopyrimidine glycosylase/DNA-(apurinic or apyrimidinic site) lyase [Armatimonadota bacterium]